MDEKLLDIQDLSVWYKTYRGFAEVVDHINLYVGKGEKNRPCGRVRLRKDHNDENGHADTGRTGYQGGRGV